MMKRVSSGNRGFTVVELMISLCISIVVVMATYQIYHSQVRSNLIQEQMVDMEQNLRSALYLLAMEIRQAGYDPGGSAGAGFVEAKNNVIGFTYTAGVNTLDDDGDGTVDEDDELTTVTYDLYDSLTDGDLDLGRKVNSGNRDAVAENIEAIEFCYTLADGTQVLDITDTAVLKNIRAVHVSVLAKAGTADDRFINRSAYTTYSNKVWTGYNDHYRRRLKTTTIKCRNRGF